MAEEASASGRRSVSQWQKKRQPVAEGASASGRGSVGQWQKEHKLVVAALHLTLTQGGTRWLRACRQFLHYASGATGAPLLPCPPYTSPKCLTSCVPAVVVP